LKNVYFSQLMIVGAGGFIGSVLRFMIGGWAQRLAATGVFPYGTLVVNVVGCLLIGFLGGLAEYRQVLEPAQRLFLMIGVLGGFTTFSAFAFETIGLMQDAQVFKAAMNTGLQVILGFTAAYAGYLGARFI
jgi:CrcB protein